MKILNEKDFREFKKLAIGLTHKLEKSVQLFDEVVKLRVKFIEEGYEMSKKQLEEIDEYENRIQECLDYFSEH